MAEQEERNVVSCFTIQKTFSLEDAFLAYAQPKAICSSHLQTVRLVGSGTSSGNLCRVSRTRQETITLFS